MKQEVLDYNAKGWNLIPIRKDNKIPATAWTQYQTERQGKEFLDKWFDNDSYNVAIITGAISGLVVLDVDPKNGAVVSDYLQRFPSNLVAVTPSGGCHIFFKHPGIPVQNRVGIFPGVDLRADGGYVNAAPSVFASGKYEWLEEGEPAQCPKILITPTNEERERNNPEDWVSTALEYGAKEGERNKTLSSLAGFFQSKELPQDITLSLLKTWNLKNENRLSPTEIETTVKSTYKTALRKSSVSKGGKQTSEASFGGKDFGLMNLEEFMVKYGDEPVDWIIRDWLPDNTIAFVVSPPGSYKTWTLLDLAVSVASGKPFLGMYPVAKKGPVFLIQQEDFNGQTAQRITLVRSSKYKDEQLPKIDSQGDVSLSMPEKIPLYIHPDRKLRLDDKAAMDDLEAAIKLLKPKLIILDPLYSLGGTDDYMAKLVEDLFIFKRFRDQYGVSFVVAHHTNKGTATDRTRAWGSQFLNAFLETGWQIEPKGDKSIKIKRHFKASNNMESISLSFNIDDKESWTYEVAEGLVDSTNKDDKEERSEDDRKVKRGPGRPPKSVKLDQDSLTPRSTTPPTSLPKNPFKKIINKHYHDNPHTDLAIKRWLQDFIISKPTKIPVFTVEKVHFVEGGSQIKEWAVNLIEDCDKRSDKTKFWTKYEIFKIVAHAPFGLCAEQLELILDRQYSSCATNLKWLHELGVLEKYEVTINNRIKFAYKVIPAIKMEDLILDEVP